MPHMTATWPYLVNWQFQSISNLNHQTMLTSRPLGMRFDGDYQNLTKTGRTILKSRSVLQENVGHYVHVPGTVAGKAKKAAIQHTPFHLNSLRELVLMINCAMRSYHVLQSHRKSGRIIMEQPNPRRRQHSHLLDLLGTKRHFLTASPTMSHHCKWRSLCLMLPQCTSSPKFFTKTH
jgi:hypothetical protein